MPDYPILPCQVDATWKQKIEDYASALEQAAYSIGQHGLSEDEFAASGLFESAIERLRGKRAATQKAKRELVEQILDHLLKQGAISSWMFEGQDERHDYLVTFADSRIACIEAKGCLDGNNTNIFQRPPNADEFIIWSLCQNSGSDPRHNAWSGIHTRLGPEIIKKRERVDGLIIWDMVCGTQGRPCPKLAANAQLITHIGDYALPPPCIFLFPRTIPDPRNNPAPPAWNLQEVRFLQILAHYFHVRSDECTKVEFHVQMNGANTQRKTICTMNSTILRESKWQDIKRSN